METVIQKYLRNDYKSIADYNATARVKEAYRVVVVFDFPVNFTESTAKMLTSIMRNGPRCGVFPIVIIDDSKPEPYGFKKQDLESFAVVLRPTTSPVAITTANALMRSGQQFEVVDHGDGFNNWRVVFDQSPPKELVDSILQAVGERARDAMKVEVAFTDLLAQAGVSNSTWWSASSKDVVTVPLGPRGATDIQEMEIGAGLAHHGLIVGRPGSGKTNLMHVIITALALRYSPEEIELYLIDFKKGVGFKAYADHSLPHARVIAIESEREFGISVLRGLDKELTRRGELFRAAGGAEKIGEYRDRTADRMPRVLLIADEFQEFFTVEDSISREASLLLDRLVRQGRAFGMHMILGTQTLAGSYGMARSTVDQISIRIALQCSETDSRLILGDDNPGARFLSRPGEAIYNAENGLVQANKLFQVAMFTDKDKEDYLARIQAKSMEGGTRRLPIVFEGHLPARLEISTDVERLTSAERPQKRKGVNAWLGEPIAIKEPTSARLRRQAGANLIIVTRDEEQGIGVLASAVTTLAVQHSDDACRFVIADYSTADAEWADFFETFCEEMPHEAKVVRRRQVPEAVKEALHEVEARHARSSSPPSSLFLVISGLHRARELRKDEDDYGADSPADDLLKVLRDGPEVGVHCLVWADTASSLTRTVGRKALAEFGTRAVGVMSNEDSQSLIDDSGAAKIDRPHRMLLFDEEQPGVLEKFRPFAFPPRNWIVQLAKRLQEVH